MRQIYPVSNYFVVIVIIGCVKKYLMSLVDLDPGSIYNHMLIAMRLGSKKL